MELRNWLNGEQNFQAGVRLLGIYNKTSSWLTIIDKLGETAFTNVKLYEQIKELHERLEAVQMPVFATKPVLKDPEDKNAPEAIVNIIKERKQNYKKANRLHESLIMYAESWLNKEPIFEAAKSKEIVFELRDLWGVIDDAWRDENHYKATGEVFVAQPKIEFVFTPGESLIARRNTLRTYLSPSYKKRISPSNLEAFLKITSAELEEIEKRLSEQEDGFV